MTRKKHYRPRPVVVPQLVARGGQVLACIQPARDWINAIHASGCVTTDAAGNIIMQQHSGEVYRALPAMSGLLVFCSLATRRGYTCPHRALSRLTTRLHYVTPIAPADLEAALLELDHLQALLMRLPSDVLWDLQNTASIQCYLEDD